jgi:hypothetical protein
VELLLDHEYRAILRFFVDVEVSVVFVDGNLEYCATHFGGEND